MRYGGNTSCVSMRSGDQPPIVFDLGTGLRYFGASWPSDRPFEGTALLTHLHWDHVQGLPVFVPLLRDGAHLDVYAPAQDDGRSVHALAIEVLGSALGGGEVEGRDPSGQHAVHFLGAADTLN